MLWGVALRCALSLFVTLAMVLGMFPAVGLADEVTVEPDDGVVAEVQGDDDEGLAEAQGVSDEDVVEVQDATSYNLWVGGVEVTDANKGNVLEGDPMNNGKVTFTPAVIEGGVVKTPATLTLNGADIKQGISKYGIYYTDPSTDLRIELSPGSTNSVGVGASLECGIYSYSGTLTITGKGSLTAIGANYPGIYMDTRSGNVTIGGGASVVAEGNHGIYTGSGQVTIEDGASVIATGTGDDGAAFSEWGSVKNAIPGIGWTDAAGTEGKSDIAISTEGQKLTYKKVQFPAEAYKYTVTLTGGANATTSGATEQTVEKGAAMAAVTYAAKDGYHFEDFKAIESNGVTAKLEGGKVVVSGKPTANVEIAIPDAVKDATPTPEVVPDASVTAHVQRIGWMDPVTDGTAAGTTGKSRRMEALTLKLPDGVAGGIEYRGHVQRSGWEKTWAADGNVAGTTGKSRRVEAVQIQLTGEAKDAYDVYYRVHVQRYGWMGWAKNGEQAGTQGMSRRAEAIQVVLVKQGDPAPAATYKGVTQQYAKAFVKK